MNKLNLGYKQLNAYADYVIVQDNIVTENGETLYQSEQKSELSLDVISISSGGSATLRFVLRDVDYSEGEDPTEDPTPFFIKRYTDILSDIFKKIEMRIDNCGHVLSVENLKEMEDSWRLMKDDIFENNQTFTIQEKENIIKSVTDAFKEPSVLVEKLCQVSHLKYLLQDFYGVDMEVGKEETPGDKIFDSIALSNFQVPLKMTRYLEEISLEKGECEISIYGILDIDKLDFKVLLERANEALQLEYFDSYNYYFDIMYIVDIKTGLIKSADIEIEETFNDDLLYKIDQFICAKNTL